MGSMLALISYPFFFQCNFDLAEMSTIWMYSFAVLLVLVGICGFVVWCGAGTGDSNNSALQPGRPAVGHRLRTGPRTPHPASCKAEGQTGSRRTCAGARRRGCRPHHLASAPAMGGPGSSAVKLDAGRHDLSNHRHCRYPAVLDCASSVVFAFVHLCLCTLAGSVDGFAHATNFCAHAFGGDRGSCRACSCGLGSAMVLDRVRWDPTY